MSPFRKVNILGLFVVTVVFAMFYLYQSHGPNANSQKSGEIEKLWRSISPYPGLIEVDHSSNSAGRRASLGAKYKSSAKYEDVKQYYSEKLRQQGWTFQRELLLSNWGRNQGGRELKWTMDEYQLSIEYAGQAGFGWDYAVGIAWYGK